MSGREPGALAAQVSAGEEPEAALLQALDEGEPLEAVLERLVRQVEASAPDGSMLGSILLLEGRRLRQGAAPDLPAAYNAAIDGIEVGPEVGSCGTAAYCGHAIYVVDIATDPLWKNFRDVALAHGLRACWSTPIRSGGRVLGTFALYYREQRAPSEAERALIERAAETARAVLERAARGPARRRGSGLTG